MTPRHGARAALILGLAASLAGNVIAAHPTALGRLVAAWPPLALLVAVELVTRIPARTGPLSVLRLGSAGLLAGIAAWVSYWHLVELARAAGEGTVAAHLLPLSVDGLVAVASICLRELAAPTPPAASPGGNLAQSAPAPVPVTLPTPEPAPSPARTLAPAVPDGTDTVRPTYYVGQGAGAAEPSKADRVRQLKAEHPDWTQAQLADAAGCTERTVRRALALDNELAALLTDPTPTTNGSHP